MDAIGFLARGSGDDLVGLIGFCVFAAIIVLIILGKAIASVSPEAMAKKIRELQAQVTKPVPATYQEPVYAEPVRAQVVAPVFAPPRKKKRRKKAAAPPSESVPRRHVADVQAPPPKAVPAPAQAGLSLQQAVIYSEILAPPLALRRGRGGLLRSAPWMR